MRRIYITLLTAILLAPATGSTAEPTMGTAHDGKVRYVHGGVGDQGEKKMKKLASDYDLWLVFTDPRERYLADVNVEIVSASGETHLAVQSKGPMLLADLPEGQYDIYANLPKRKKAKQTVMVREEDRTKIVMRLGDR